MNNQEKEMIINLIRKRCNDLKYEAKQLICSKEGYECSNEYAKRLMSDNNEVGYPSLALIAYSSICIIASMTEELLKNDQLLMNYILSKEQMNEIANICSNANNAYDVQTSNKGTYAGGGIGAAAGGFLFGGLIGAAIGGALGAFLGSSQNTTNRTFNFDKFFNVVQQALNKYFDFICGFNVNLVQCGIGKIHNYID